RSSSPASSARTCARNEVHRTGEPAPPTSAGAAMTETNEPAKIQRGLRGVYFDRSPCTFIDGKAGELRYRGYSIHDLAQHSTFEETAWLLLNGDLPTSAGVAAFHKGLKGAR